MGRFYRWNCPKFSPNSKHLSWDSRRQPNPRACMIVLIGIFIKRDTPSDKYGDGSRTQSSSLDDTNSKINLPLLLTLLISFELWSMKLYSGKKNAMFIRLHLQETVMSWEWGQPYPLNNQNLRPPTCPYPPTTR
ncbi:hypothetical protein SAY87_027907 [Trapa incisa]|uniref:Uncharacterized protein n=1 Tax=Trapa incisa TaxID=236973 RepID=A0AAN7KNJ2_9MYRT|nr:hypothetical protein SAY87_027907 [Trapa incisa]